MDQLGEIQGLAILLLTPFMRHSWELAQNAHFEVANVTLY